MQFVCNAKCLNAHVKNNVPVYPNDHLSWKNNLPVLIRGLKCVNYCYNNNNNNAYKNN